MTGNSYLFVDGGYLRGALESLRKNFFDVDPSINYSGILEDCQKAFYYDAYPGKKNSQSAEEHEAALDEAEQSFSVISSTPSWHVNVGFTRGQGKRIRQKGVDVRLAIEALMHRIRGNCDRVVLLAGDLDFHPLAVALVEAGAYVDLLCERASVSDELCQAVDRVTFLSPKKGGKYAKNWQNISLGCTQENSESIPQGTLVKEGSVVDGEAKIIYDGSKARLVYKTKGMKMYHMMSLDCADKLEYYSTIELPFIKWS
jgi:uncharacterized LabA/DUF88 family protein